MHRQYFVSGIGTEVGKTVASAVLARYLKSEYWKPVQAGDLDYSDTMKVAELAGLSSSEIWPERFRLNHPMSPHAAAALDKTPIRLSDFSLPSTSNPLIVEGAGGLMVPLNDQDLIIDLMAQLSLSCILVSRHYLGSINHSILSIEALRARGIEIAGIIINGNENQATEEAILGRYDIPLLFRIPECSGTITPEWISEVVKHIKPEECPI